MGRKTTTERGYGGKHQKLRKQWQARIDAGETVTCWRCAEKGEPHAILPGDEWDLGHDDDNRSVYRGPECISGNRATMTRRAAQELNSRIW